MCFVHSSLIIFKTIIVLTDIIIIIVIIFFLLCSLGCLCLNPWVCSLLPFQLSPPSHWQWRSEWAAVCGHCQLRLNYDIWHQTYLQANFFLVKSLRFKIRPLDLAGFSSTSPLPFIFCLRYYNFLFSFLSIFTSDFSSSKFYYFLCNLISSQTILNFLVFSKPYIPFSILVSHREGFFFFYFLFQKFEISSSFPNSNRYLSLQHQVPSKLSIAVNEINTEGRKNRV